MVHRYDQRLPRLQPRVPDLSIRATQLGLKACEVPVTRAYPATGKTPTKISGFKGNSDLMKVLLNALAGKYNP